ncbi:hypothetical protein NMY22_g19595 [Coprinellus aureogranulatus]|nr:hypothetical protein NMY22_g19595 [Coprinellus aureogranulatus]
MHGRAPWLVYTEWKKKYGDLVYYSYFGNKILILNSYDAMVDLYEKRGDIYSSRSRRTMVQDILGFGFMLTTMPDDERWKMHRHLFHRYFGNQERKTYNAAQIAHIHSYLRNLLENPREFRYNSRRAAVGVVLSLLYGYHVSSENDRYVFLVDKSLKATVEAGPFGTFMVDYIPWLRFVPTWFPFAGWKRKAMVSRGHIIDSLNSPFDSVKEQMRRGVAEPCLVTAELEALENEDEHTRASKELIIKNTAATALMAGSDTTVSLTLSFWLVCTKFPEVQRRAQAEVDRVCPDRLPDLSDRPQLPVIQSMVYELLRWNPATPVGVPHYVRSTNEYRGFTIPAGTTVIANMWLMLHDEKVYPDPFEFKIDRFLDQDGKIVEPGTKRTVNPIPDAAVFGIGKRKCPGNYIGTDFLFLMVTHLLKTFEASRALDERGKEIDPPAIYSPGLGRCQRESLRVDASASRIHLSRKRYARVNTVIEYANKWGLMMRFANRLTIRLAELIDMMAAFFSNVRLPAIAEPSLSLMSQFVSPDYSPRTGAFPPAALAFQPHDFSAWPTIPWTQNTRPVYLHQLLLSFPEISISLASPLTRYEDYLVEGRFATEMTEHI